MVFFQVWQFQCISLFIHRKDFFLYCWKVWLTKKFVIAFWSNSMFKHDHKNCCKTRQDCRHSMFFFSKLTIAMHSQVGRYFHLSGRLSVCIFELILALKTWFLLQCLTKTKIRPHQDFSNAKNIKLCLYIFWITD